MSDESTGQALSMQWTGDNADGVVRWLSPEDGWDGGRVWLKQTRHGDEPPDENGWRWKLVVDGQEAKKGDWIVQSKNGRQVRIIADAGSALPRG